MKKTAVLLAILATVGLNGLAIAQNPSQQNANCISGKEDPLKVDLAMLIRINNTQGMEKILKTKCFDTSSQNDFSLYYLTKSVDTLKLLEKYDRNPGYADYIKKIKKDSKRQLISELMVSPFYYYPLAKEFEEEVKNPELRLKKYGVSKEEIEKNDVAIVNEESREALLKYVAEKTVKATLITKDDIDYNAYAYAIYLSENSVLDVLLKNAISKRDLINKNVHEISPVHLAFAPKVFAGSDAKINEEKLKKTNDLIVEHLDKKFIPLLTIRSMPFWTYVELYKNNNLDLYKKLKEKHNFKATGLEFFKKENIKASDLDVKAKIIEYGYGK